MNWSVTVRSSAVASTSAGRPGPVERQVHGPHDVPVRRVGLHLHVREPRRRHERERRVRPARRVAAPDLVAVERRVDEGVPRQLDARGRRGHDRQPGRRRSGADVSRARVDRHRTRVRGRRRRPRPGRRGPRRATSRRWSSSSGRRSRSVPVVSGRKDATNSSLLPASVLNVASTHVQSPLVAGSEPSGPKPACACRPDGRARLGGDAVDPDLAVDVVRAVGRADLVGQRGRPLEVRPADDVLRDPLDLVRERARVAGRVVGRDHDVHGRSVRGGPRA